jgi:hypothetical protein
MSRFVWDILTELPFVAGSAKPLALFVEVMIECRPRHLHPLLVSMLNSAQ